MRWRMKINARNKIVHASAIYIPKYEHYQIIMYKVIIKRVKCFVYTQ